MPIRNRAYTHIVEGSKPRRNRRILNNLNCGSALIEYKIEIFEYKMKKSLIKKINTLNLILILNG